MKLKSLFIVIFLALLTQAAFAEVVAVLPFKCLGEGNSQSIALSVSQQIIVAFSKEKKYKMIDKESMKKILDEQKLSSSDLYETDSLKIGKLLVADLMISGTVIHENGKYMVYANLLSVSTGKILKAFSPQFIKNIEESVGLGNKIAVKFLNQVQEKEELDYTGTWTIIATAPVLVEKKLKYKKLVLTDEMNYELILVNDLDNVLNIKGKYFIEGNQITFHQGQLFVNGRERVSPAGWLKAVGTIYLVNNELYFSHNNIDYDVRWDAMDPKYRNTARKKE